MAVHHPATITPTKRDLLQAWVPHQPWTGGGDLTELTPVGSYRFDDPDGEVGMETHLLATPDGRVLQVPLTYRGTPGPPDTLVTTMTHTTLGDRWIHDGCHDPVLLTALATTVLHGGREADLYEATPDGLTLLPATTHVRGDGPTPGAPTHPGDWTHPHVEHTGTTTVVRAPATTTACASSCPASCPASCTPSPYQAPRCAAPGPARTPPSSSPSSPPTHPRPPDDHPPGRSCPRAPTPTHPGVVQ